MSVCVLSFKKNVSTGWAVYVFCVCVLNTASALFCFVFLFLTRVFFSLSCADMSCSQVCKNQLDVGEGAKLELIKEVKNVFNNMKHNTNV